MLRLVSEEPLKTIIEITYHLGTGSMGVKLTEPGELIVLNLIEYTLNVINGKLDTGRVPEVPHRE